MCVCVFVYMLLRPKVGSKTSFGAIRSFLPLKLWNSELHNLSLVSNVPSPSFTLLLSMVVVVVHVVVIILE